MLLAAVATGRPSTAHTGHRRIQRIVGTRRIRRIAETRRIEIRLRRSQAEAGAGALAAIATALLTPFPVALIAAPGVLFVSRALLRRLPAPGPPPLPPHVLASCTDLLAACLEAGAIPADALAATGAALPDPVGQQLRRAARSLAGGTPIEQALPEEGALAPIAAVFRRSSRTGSAMTEQLVALADQLRADDQFDRLERAHRVGVLSALPLGLCMLPAFLLLAVVPAVAGLGGGLLR